MQCSGCGERWSQQWYDDEQKPDVTAEASMRTAGIGTDIGDSFVANTPVPPDSKNFDPQASFRADATDLDQYSDIEENDRADAGIELADVTDEMPGEVDGDGEAETADDSDPTQQIPWEDEALDEASTRELDAAIADAAELAASAAAPATTSPSAAMSGRTATHRFRRPRLLAGAAFASTFLVLVAIFLAARDPILGLFPRSRALYDLLHLAPSVLGEGLQIGDVTSSRETRGSDDLLTVTGVVANITGQPIRVPTILVTLYDADDHELHAVKLPENDLLAAGDTARFKTTITNPPPEARRIRVGFVSSQS